MRERVDLKSPVREYRPPGSVRGAPGNRCPYLDRKRRDKRLQACRAKFSADNELNQRTSFGPFFVLFVTFWLTLLLRPGATPLHSDVAKPSRPARALPAVYKSPRHFCSSSTLSIRNAHSRVRPRSAPQRR